MSATMDSPTATTQQPSAQGSAHGASYGAQVRTLVRRNLIHIKRQPEMLSDVTIQPIMFVLLFAFVFGGSIATNSEGGYREWLLPGIMGQTMAFASFIVALGLTNDLKNGVIDRFRSLPMHRSSVLVARSVSSLMHSSIGIVVMALTGLIVGWRIRNGLGDALLAFALLLLFGFAMIWIGILVGSSLSSVEAVNGVMFASIFPLTFVANTFAPTENMPTWLRTIAEWNPLSSLVQSLRELWGNNGGVPVPDSASWPMHHPVLFSAIGSIVIAAIFAPLAIRAFTRRTTD